MIIRISSLLLLLFYQELFSRKIQSRESSSNRGYEFKKEKIIKLRIIDICSNSRIRSITNRVSRTFEMKGFGVKRQWGLLYGWPGNWKSWRTAGNERYTPALVTARLFFFCRLQRLLTVHSRPRGPVHHVFLDTEEG